MSARAYTYLDRSKAVVGNRWFERRWSTFLGNTTSLRQKPPTFEWVSGQSTEFGVVVDGRTLGLMDFGEVSWSEENSPDGATLVSSRASPGLTFTTRTLAFHDNPGMLRTTALFNRGDAPVTIDRVTTENLAIGHGDVRVRTHGFAQTHEAIAWRTKEPAAALTVGAYGLIFGQEHGGLFDLFATDPGACGTPVETPGQLAPGEAWRLPSTFLIPYKGDLDKTVVTVYEDFLGRCRDVRNTEPEDDKGPLRK